MTLERRGAATLEIEPRSRQVAIHCRHGTALGGNLHTGPIGESAVVAMVILRHREGFGCCCAGELERQYPAALIPLGVTVVEVLG